jgi:putative CGCGG family rSAM target protein
MSDAHSVDDAESVTDRLHENSWSANLERPEHAADRQRVIEEALDAIACTAPGYHVNLVTHGDHGHPRSYLYDVLESEYGKKVEFEYVEQCGCGGHVTRVTIHAQSRSVNSSR